MSSVSNIWYVRAAAVLSTAATAVLLKNSYDGSRPMWDQREQAIVDNLQYDDFKHSWGMYSGEPGFDSMAYWLERSVPRGPFGIRLAYERAKTQVQGLWNDVIVKNAVPIVLATGAVYAGFHNQIHAGLRGISKALRSNAFGSVLSPIGSMAKEAFIWTGRRIGDAASLTLKAAQKSRWAGLAFLGLGAFTAYRLKNVLDGTEQRERFEPLNMNMYQAPWM